MKLLLETGRVDVDFKDCDGGTTLSLAAGNGHEVVVKLLLETGRVDAVEERETHNNITALHDDSSLKKLARTRAPGSCLSFEAMTLCGGLRCCCRFELGRFELGWSAFGSRRRPCWVWSLLEVYCNNT